MHNNKANENDDYFAFLKLLFHSSKRQAIFKTKKKLILFSLLLAILFINIQYYSFEKSKKKSELIYFDQYEANRYKEIEQKLVKNLCTDMWDNQGKFLNGVIRKFQPKKILEIGVNRGGSSIIILNAIRDIENAKLYSIDLNSEKKIGKCVREYFPYLLDKWSLFKGNIATEFIENIGNNIDIALIDSAHFEPGEILDFLIILPFLKENSILIFHDIANQITHPFGRNEWAPYIIFNAIRGEKYLPSGNKILTHDIGAIKLEKNQKKFYHDYFRLLGGQWQYFPKEIFIKSLTKHFKKYYDQECLVMFEETVKFNRIFVKKNPKKNIYKINSD